MSIATRLADAETRREQFVEFVNRDMAVHNAVCALLQELRDEQEAERLEAERLEAERLAAESVPQAEESWVDDLSDEPWYDLGDDATFPMTGDAAGDVSESVS